MKWITCDRCGSNASDEMDDHVVVYAMGGEVNLRFEYCLDCGAELADVLERFETGETRGETREEKQQRQYEERLARDRAWKATAGEQRQQLILETLGSDRLTLGQIADRVTERHGDEYGGRIFDGELRNEVQKMLIAGELKRVRGDDYRGKPRYLYFRPSGLRGAIADLEALLNDESEA